MGLKNNEQNTRAHLQPEETELSGGHMATEAGNERFKMKPARPNSKSHFSRTYSG